MLLVWGCVGTQPFVNEPPRLLSVNDVEVRRAVVIATLPDPTTPGEPYELRVEVEDPERDEVRVLFPEAPGEVRFDPDAREGVWVPPPDRPEQTLRMYLEDDGSPPAGQVYDLFFGPWGHSGG